MVHTEGVLDVREHGEKARTLPRGHAEIFALERKRHRELVLAEVALKHVEDRTPSEDVGDQAHGPLVDQVGEAQVGPLQAGSDPVEARFLRLHKAIDTELGTGVARGDLGLRPFQVTRGIVGKPVGELESVHRVQFHELDPVGAVLARLGEYLVQEILHHEKGRADVEAVGIEHELAIASAHLLAALVHGDGPCPGWPAAGRK